MTQHNKRAEPARAHDDHDLIDEMETSPTQSGLAGGNQGRADPVRVKA